jgi:hypothetical protein
VEGRWFGRFAVEQFGADRALSISKEVCLLAAEADPVVARAVAPFLDQPLKPMRTFIAFSDCAKHSDWVQHCRETIPESDWIREEDSAIVSESPIKERQFQFGPAEPRRGIDRLFDETFYSIVSYLTHFTPNVTRTLPLRVESLETFALSNTDDIRLVIGFFFYASSVGFHTTRISEWTERLTTSRTDSDLYAVSLFLTNLSIPVARWPPGLAAFIGRHLLFHGHSNLTAESLARAFQRERGVRWYFIRSVISIDPTPLTAYPLVRAEFADATRALPLLEAFLRQNGPAIKLEIWTCFFSTILSVLLRPPIGAPYMLFPVTHPVLATLPPAPPRPQLIALDAGRVQRLRAAKTHR